MSKETEGEGSTDGEQEAAQAAWNDLIQILQSEKENLEKAQEPSDPDN